MANEKKNPRDNFKDNNMVVTDESNEISENDFNVDFPCHKEVTNLTQDLEFCPVCGFYTPKNNS